MAAGEPHPALARAGSLDRVNMLPRGSKVGLSGSQLIARSTAGRTASRGGSVTSVVERRPRRRFQQSHEP
jgi:hypothetical protein